ncbi:MAG TPA: NADH-quinone oxidoreductase subunit J, partial [Candidatus Saccharimonadia bacterium]|nr:NADH-quinone oxidoreductase subunit J [Candidatus Saccharimonadia bacterium]
VVFHRNPMSSAIYLVVTMLCLAGFYALLAGPFVAVIQVLVYAGAVMVLILFVIMMLNLREETLEREGSMVTWIIAGLIGLGLVVAVARKFPRTPAGTPEPAFGTIEEVGNKLFTVYMLPFELTSVLLLIAIIGAVSLAKRRML